VTVYPYERHDCAMHSAVRMAPGTTHTWRTATNDDGIHTFFVSGPDGRQRGCLGQDRFDHAGTVIFGMGDLRECVT
jgi:hypothetical protein